MEENQERDTGSGEKALWRQSFEEEKESESVFSGILLLVAIGLGLSVLIELYKLCANIQLLAQPASPDAPSWMRSPADHPMNGIIVSVFSLGISIALCVLFVRRKRLFRTAMIWLLALGVVSYLFIVLAADKFTHGTVIHQPAPAMLGRVLGMAIWLPYYLFSNRVKRTFVR